VDEIRVAYGAQFKRLAHRLGRQSQLGHARIVMPGFQPAGASGASLSASSTQPSIAHLWHTPLQRSMVTPSGGKIPKL